MSALRPGLPRPLSTPLTEGFWRAAAEGRLSIQRCDACGFHRHAPAPVCYRCQSAAWSWDEVSGRGTVYSYTWSHHPVHPGLAPLGVYNVAVVQLEGTQGEPVRLVSWIEGVSPERLRIGMAVEVRFDPLDEGLALPYFVGTACETSRDVKK